MTAASASAEIGFRPRTPVSRTLAPLLPLLALLLLGFWLRVHNLDAFSFWTDEGLTPARSGYPIAQILRNEIVIQGIVTTDTHPPLYYLVIALTRRLFGLSDFAFRYPSVLFGVLLIPLLYRLARRLPSPSRAAGGVTAASMGLLVALLATVNPLQVYYSQEARMYTLLALLATGMSYVLWRAMEATIDRRPLTGGKLQVISDGSRAQSAAPLAVRPWPLAPDGRRSPAVSGRLLLYALLASLAVYTHYTAAFLIAAQSLLWAWLLWRAGLRRVIIGAIVVGLLAAIPLLPYTLPRLTSGPEANYFAVSPLTVVADAVRFFHLGLTVDFALPAVQALNWLALGLLIVGFWAARRWPARLFLLIWLLAVPLGLIAGSALFKPMYQGVRHIMAASPAFLLLLGYGLAGVPALARRSAPRNAGHNWQWAAERGLTLLVANLLLAGAAAALLNLYINPAFVKDDFRAIVRFIETRAGGRDVIVYNNAVLLPLHEHYRLRPDVAVTALPAYPQLATGQEPELGALVAQYDRIWFITDPPADGRDDERLIQDWFNDNLREVSDRLFPARTTEARVIGYATTGSGQPPAAGGQTLPCSPTPSLPGSPTLLLCSRIDRTPLTLPTLWVDLWWEGTPAPPESSIVFTLTGPDGAEHYRRAHPLRREKVAWDTTAPNTLSYDLPLPPGLPPGAYTLAIGLEGQETVALGEVEVASTGAWPVSPEALFGDTELAPLSRRPVVRWNNGLQLAAAVPWDERVIAGNNLPVTLFWRVGPAGLDLAPLRYRLEVIDGSGEVLRSQETRPGAAWLGHVPGDVLLREVTSLYFRPETPAGRYHLRWTLLDGDTAIGRPAIAGQIIVAPETQP